MSPLKILLVCYANLCRSPLAEGIVKHQLNKIGKSDNVIVRSAGIHAYEGSPPASKSVQVAKERGIDISKYGGVQLTEEMAKDADLILTLDESVKQHILAYYVNDNDTEKVLTLKECAGETEDLDVADPYGLSTDTFRKCADEIEDYSAIILEKLKL